MHGPLADPACARASSPGGLVWQLVFIIFSCSLSWNVVTEEADGEYSGRHHAANFDTCSILLVWALGAVVVNADSKEASRLPPPINRLDLPINQMSSMFDNKGWGLGALADPAVPLDNPPPTRSRLDRPSTCWSCCDRCPPDNANAALHDLI